MDLGRVYFRNARSSGIILNHLGSGSPDHLGFFGPGGHQSAVEIGSYQDTTIFTNSTGTPSPTTFGGTQYCTNCKFIDSTHVRISGTPLGPYNALITNVNKFNVANLSTAPNFRNRPSGTLLIQYTASGTQKVHTFNAKIYAYDNTLTIVDPPTDVTVLGFEINASGRFKNLAHSGVWHAMAGRDNALEFLDHSATNGYRSAHTHIWVAAISVKANSVGVLDGFDFGFQTQFA